MLAPGWHHLALTYDGARAALWIDGAEVAHAALSGALAYSAGASGYDFNGVALGAPPVSEVASVAAFDSPSAFVGRLANLRLYAEALDADALAGLATGSQQR
ncbi:MAG: LamG-like jellyroll fold domain-containing protein [Myxococcota bacterium]